VIEELLAEVVAHLFALQADKVDKKEHRHRLDEHNCSIEGEEPNQCGFISGNDAFIDDALVDQREISIQ